MTTSNTTSIPATTAELTAAILACKTDADRSRMGAFLAEYFAAVAKFNPHHAQIWYIGQIAKANRIQVAR